MTTQQQQSPYLPKQRNFPNNNAQALGVELDKSYIDIAGKVNEKVIGVYALETQLVTGETWYIYKNKRQQTLRRVYIFDVIEPGAELTIVHGITDIQIFTKIYGTVVTDIPDYRPLPYVDVTDITKCMAILVDVTEIKITLGAAADKVQSGLVVLEWITQL